MLARRWRHAEDQLLRELYADQLSVERIAHRLGRTPDAVLARRRHLHIPARRARRWSQFDDALLSAAAAAGVPTALLAERLGRSPEQVRARRRMLVGTAPAGRPYLAHEDEAIRLCLSEHGDLAALAHRLGRSPDALRLHAQHLGLHHPPPRRRWTEWEDAVIRDGYTSALPYAEIARQLPHRTPTSVAARARKLDLISYARRWSIHEDHHLRLLTARGSTLEDVAQRLGRTPEAIRRHAARLGIYPPLPAPAPRYARRWTREEDELLRLHQALNPARLAELLGRSDTAVCRRSCALGLRAHAQRSPHRLGNGKVASADPSRARPAMRRHTPAPGTGQIEFSDRPRAPVQRLRAAATRRSQQAPMATAPLDHLVIAEAARRQQQG